MTESNHAAITFFPNPLVEQSRGIQSRFAPKAITSNHAESICAGRAITQQSRSNHNQSRASNHVFYPPLRGETDRPEPNHPARQDMTHPMAERIWP